MGVQGLPNEERGAMEEAEWPTGIPAAGEEMAAIGDHERACRGGEGGREREGSRGEMGHTGERGHEEAEWPTGMLAAGEGMVAVRDHKRACRGGEANGEREDDGGERGCRGERGRRGERHHGGEGPHGPWACRQPGRGRWRSKIVKGLAEEGRAAKKERVAEKERAAEERGAMEERGASKERGATEEAVWPIGMPAGGEGMAVAGDCERPCRGGEGGIEREGKGGERGHGGGRVGHGRAGSRGGWRRSEIVKWLAEEGRAAEK